MNKRMPQINSDFNIFCSARLNSMKWVPSPAPGIWRKRVYMDGPSESCKVTSIVRYDAGAHFPPHDHPGGEEILVLDGTFSDDGGNFSDGWHLLHPDGFRHQSYSEEGCLILVKLRQYSGKETVLQDTEKLEWVQGSTNGVTCKSLYRNEELGISTYLIHYAKDTTIPLQNYPEGKEIYVLNGTLVDSFGTHDSGSWLRYPTGAASKLVTRNGCMLYVQNGGLQAL